MEIAIALIVGVALGYGVREWISRRRRQADCRQARFLDLSIYEQPNRAELLSRWRFPRMNPHGRKSEVERYLLEGKIKEIADYCEPDVVNTYRVWLRYELFRGRLSESEHQASERNLANFRCGSR
jgi:predicted PolB exonuclease-like 3'-5' exonuclease